MAGCDCWAFMLAVFFLPHLKLFVGIGKVHGAVRYLIKYLLYVFFASEHIVSEPFRRGMLQVEVSMLIILMLFLLLLKTAQLLLMLLSLLLLLLLLFFTRSEGDDVVEELRKKEDLLCLRTRYFVTAMLLQSHLSDRSNSSVIGSLKSPHLTVLAFVVGFVLKKCVFTWVDAAIQMVVVGCILSRSVDGPFARC